VILQNKQASPNYENLNGSLALGCIFFAFVSAVEKFSIEKLHSNHSKNEMEE